MWKFSRPYFSQLRFQLKCWEAISPSVRDCANETSTNGKQYQINIVFRMKAEETGLCYYVALVRIPASQRGI
jgi:hypothetical protein